MNTKLIRKPENYLWLTCLIVLTYVIFMTFIFPKAWADTSQMRRLTEMMSSVVPMIGNLQKFPNYENYWGVFYAFFWIIALIFPILGFVSTFFLSESGMIALKQKSGLKFIFVLFFLGAINLFIFTVPDAGSKPWFNEVSKYFLVLLFTCFEISGCLYGLGLFVGLCRLKSKENFDQIKG